jgi:hypothetical protein
MAEQLAVMGTEVGADKQGGDPVDSSTTARGGVVRGDAGSKEGPAKVVFSGKRATVARGGAADTVRGEAREMWVGE